MPKNNPINKTVALFLVFSLLLTMAMPRDGWTQQACETAVTEAENLYNAGTFDEVIKILEACLPDKLKEEEKGKAYRLLGLTFLAKDYLEQARQAVQELLKVAPNWQSDPVQDPPPFTQLVEEVRAQIQEQQPERQQPQKPSEIVQPRPKGRSKALLWIGLGAAVVGGGIIAALAGGGGNGPVTPPGAERLPDPPGDPSGN